MAIKLLRYLSLAAFVGLGALRLGAGELPAGFMPLAPSFETQVISQSGPGVFPTRCAQISLGTNKFAFLVPEEFRVDTSKPAKTIVASPDFTRIFTFSVNPWIEADAGEVNAETCRGALLAEHPRAVILSETGVCANNQSGPLFELRWNPATNLVRVARVAYVPSRAGVLEFNMVSSVEKSAEARADFNFILLTFRASGPDGKLALPCLYTKF